MFLKKGFDGINGPASILKAVSVSSIGAASNYDLFGLWLENILNKPISILDSFFRIFS